MFELKFAEELKGFYYKRFSCGGRYVPCKVILLHKNITKAEKVSVLEIYQKGNDIRFDLLEELTFDDVMDYCDSWGIATMDDVLVLTSKLNFGAAKGDSVTIRP